MTTDPAFETLLEYVESELGFATSHYNRSYLDRRVSSRMRRTGSDDYETYLELLRSDPDEPTALLDSLSINVTGFFRNPDVWEGIRDLLRQLTEEATRNGEQVHVWSAACADGREPYSLSMLAHDDEEIDESALTILGTDISDPALESARNRRYTESRTVDLEDQLAFLSSYERYVDHDADTQTYTVARDVARTVTFERHDLINGPQKSGFDLVVCRNLFIYIDNEYKQTILESIADSLRPDGYLVIGKAETIPPSLKSAFAVRDGRLRIYQRDPSVGDAEEAPSSSRSSN